MYSLTADVIICTWHFKKRQETHPHPRHTLTINTAAIVVSNALHRIPHHLAWIVAALVNITGCTDKYHRCRNDSAPVSGRRRGCCCFLFPVLRPLPCRRTRITHTHGMRLKKTIILAMLEHSGTVPTGCCIVHNVYESIILCIQYHTSYDVCSAYFTY